MNQCLLARLAAAALQPCSSRRLSNKQHTSSEAVSISLASAPEPERARPQNYSFEHGLLRIDGLSMGLQEALHARDF